MSKPLDARTTAAIGAIRQAIQQSQEPGLSVNSHPNPFFLSIIGSIDLRKIAELVIERVDAVPPEPKPASEPAVE